MEQYFSRVITSDDISEVQSIWASRFPEDSPKFVDWLFHKRFSPEASICVESDRKIVSMVLGYPMEVRVRGVSLPALMLYGVSTLPGYEHRGLMHVGMSGIFNLCRDMGIPCVMHTPVHFSTYASLGHFPCTRSKYYHGEGGQDSSFNPLAPFPSVSELTVCYRQLTEKYSGCVIRTERDMALRLDDYHTDDAVCVSVRKNDRLTGYAILSPDGDGWQGAEAVALDEEAYAALTRRLPAGSVTKLPPDAPVSGEVLPQGVMGAVHVPGLLKDIVNDSAMTFQITDPVLPENNGVFDGCGSPCARTAQFNLSAGELMQALCGYTGLGESLPPLPCFCIEPY